MTVQSDVLGIIPGMQSVALLGANLKMAKNIGKPHQSLKSMNKNILKAGVTNIVGVGLIGATASAINGVK